MNSKDKLIELIDTATSRYIDLVNERHEVGQTVAKTCAECEAEYLLANNVIPFPCKFQQTVWVLPTIENNLPELTEMECIGFILSCDSYNANLVTDKNKLYQPCFGDFGKTVFLTKEEAEEKLREMKDNA